MMISFEKPPPAWQVELQWAKNRQGYFLDPIGRGEPRFPPELSQHDSKRNVFHFLRPKGKLSEEVVDINSSIPLYQLIFLCFANIKVGNQTQNLLNFYNKYGSLFQKNSTITTLEYKGNIEDVEKLNPFDTESYVLAFVDDVRKFLDDVISLRQTKTHIDLPLREPLTCEFELRLRPESTTLIVRPANLYGFIRLQLYRWAATGRALDKCRVCGKFMMPKSSKREFCGSTCRSRANRSKDKIR